LPHAAPFVFCNDTTYDERDTRMQSWIHVIEWRATVHPEVTALVDDRGAVLTYAELRTAVESRAGGWADLGVKPGDVVAVLAKNSASFLVHAFAILRAGAIPAFVNWRLSPAELAEVLALVEPVALGADAEFTALAEAAAPGLIPRVVIGGGTAPDGWLDEASLAGPVPPRPRLSASDVLALVHTSGTTGRAKAIPLRHGALLVSVAGFAIEIGDQVTGSRHLQLLPLFHLGGFGQCLQALLTAGTVYVHGSFSPAAVIDAIERDRIEFFTAGPSLIDALVGELGGRAVTPDLTSLKEIAYGTAPITPASLTAAMAALPCRFRQIYGNTESQSMISLLAPEDHQPGHPRLASAGRVSFGWEVKVVDPADPAAAALPPDSAGEVLIKGECLFSGYWRDPEQTAAAFTADGWYRTGDIGRLTADGYLYILDRAKDMLISGGENIYPVEVEAVLAGHPGIAEVAVIGRPDPAWGEAVHAVVRLADGASATGEEIIAWCRDRLSHFKCPKTVEFTGPLPRTTTGKVLKRELRSRLRTESEGELCRSDFPSPRIAGWRPRRSARSPLPPSGPGSARSSSPKDMETRCRCATRSRRRPGQRGLAPRSRTRPCGPRCWPPRPRPSLIRPATADSSWGSASPTT
jgi:acyl-CoA synthetase (AMP-forming)/AMP-acid ligase II